MSDINTYSLSLNLDVQSNADAVLDDTAGLLSDIQSELDKMSSSLGVGMRDASAEVANAISDIAQQSAMAEKSMASMVPQMAAAGASAESSATYYEDLVGSLEDAVEEHENITDELTDQEKLLMDALESHEDIEDSVERQVGLYDNITKSLDNNIKRLRTTVLGMEAISRAWGMLIEDEERFVTANYRLHGTQREMLDQVAEITDEYGLMREGAMEAYAELASKLRVPQEELAELTSQVTKFNRITGSNVAVTAEWVKQMKYAGYTSKDTERMLSRMTAAMEEYGLSTQAMESHTKEMTNTTGTAMMVWGEENVEAFQNANLEMKAWARELPQMQALMHKGLIDPLHGVGNTLAAAGRGHEDYAGQIHGAGTVEQQVYEMRLGHLQVMKQVEHATAGMESAQARQAATAALLTSRGIEGAEAQNEWRLMMEKWEKAGVSASMTMEEHMAALQSSLTDAEKSQDQYNQSIDTLSSAWKTAIDSMMSVWHRLVSAIAPQVIWLIKNVLTPIIDIAKTIVKVLTAGFKVVMIVLYPVIKVVEALIAVFRGFWSVIDDAISPFIEIIDIIYKALFEGAEAGTSFADTFKFVGKVLGYITTAFIQPLVWIFKGIAAALRGMSEGTSTFGSIIKAVFFPFGAMIKAIGWAIDGISAAFSGFWSVAKGIFDPFVQIFGELSAVFGELWDTIKQVFEPLFDAFAGLSEAFSTGEDSGFSFMTVFEQVGKAIAWVVRVGLGPLTLGIQMAGKVLTFFARILKEVIAFGLAPIKWMIEQVTAALDKVGEAAEWVSEKYNDLAGEGTLLGGAMEFAGDAFDKVTDPLGTLGDMMESVIDFFGASGAGLIEESEWLAEAFNKLAGPAEIIAAAIGTIGDAMDVVIDSVDALVVSVIDLSKDWDKMLGGATVMFAFGSTLLGAAGMIFAGSSMMMMAGPMFLAGMSALAVGIWMFDADKVNEIADSLWGLATGIVAVGRAKDQLSGIGDAIYDVANQVKVIGSSIAYVNDILWTAAIGLMSYSAYLSHVYGVIASVISAGMDRIESEAQRAWSILVPLQFLAGGLGLSLADLMDIGKYFDQPIQAETISQIQVLTEEEGGKAADESKVSRWRIEQLNILRKIDGKMDKIGAGGAMPDLDEIKNLLATHLPKMSQSPSKLGTKMNDWV